MAGIPRLQSLSTTTPNHVHCPWVNTNDYVPPDDVVDTIQNSKLFLPSLFTNDTLTINTDIHRCLNKCCLHVAKTNTTTTTSTTSTVCITCM